MKVGLFHENQSMTSTPASILNNGPSTKRVRAQKMEKLPLDWWVVLFCFVLSCLFSFYFLFSFLILIDLAPSSDSEMDLLVQLHYFSHLTQEGTFLPQKLMR